MGNLIKFILRFRGFILFLILEGIAVTLLSYNSHYQQTQIFGALQAVQSSCYEFAGKVTAYLALKDENELLLRENAKLRNMLDYYQSIENAPGAARVSSVEGKLFSYTPARVVSGTTNRQNNYFVLNVGEWQNVFPEMGVATDNGVVGIVVNTSAHYATVMSLLNRSFKISARIRRSGYLGTLMWDGRSYREAILAEVPQHVMVEVGDTVETSGYSAMFPEGIPIGTITSYEIKKGNFHEIRVQLDVDFKKLRHVNVIKFMHTAEFKELEQALPAHQNTQQHNE
ncbi:MAG: rod shape-determining protein MreC [Prevotellaceae bacterium]|jgi:rod shape-determining protein MreC|nr:rod shape-determining protein MreC [Prevotellaceae bacterium]